MGETLNLNEAIENLSQEEEIQEIVTENTENTETNTDAKPTDDKPKEGDVDAFDGLTEVKDLNTQFVTMEDGKRMKVSDLIDGNMRQEDYTQKTMELSEARHQLDLAKSTTPVDTTKEQKAAIDLTEENAAIELALKEMDETDPIAIVMKGIFNQNNQVINFINTQAVQNQQVANESITEENVKNAQRLISEAMDKESKNYNLPVIKGGDGEETNMKSLWNEMVLTELQAINENLNLAQFNHRVSQVGKGVFKKLRTIISVASSKKPKDEAANENKGSQNTTETKPAGSTDKAPDAETNKENKSLSLGERLENAMDKLAVKQ